MAAGERLREDPTLAPLLLLCVCGAALRFTGLDTQSLWLDELISWSQSSETDVARVIARMREDVHPPVHALVLYAVQRFCGDSETWLRLPSAIAGVLTIPAVYAFVRRLYGPREALFGALLLTFGETPIHYSQTARPYALLVLAACTSGFFWVGVLRALRGRTRVGLASAAGFAASAIAAAYLHYFGVLLVALQCLALLAFGRAPARAAALVLPVALAGLPWLPALAEDAGREGFWIVAPDLDEVRKTWRYLFRRPGELHWIVAGLCALFLGRRAWQRWRTPGSLRALPDSPTFLVLCWLVAPTAIAFAASKLWIPIYTTRNLLVVLPAAYALTARAITDLCPAARAQRVAAAALLVVLLAGLFITDHYYTRVRHTQFRELTATFVRRDAEAPDALVLFFGARPEYLRYYQTRFGARSVDIGIRNEAPETIEAGLRELDLRGPARLWLLAAHREPPPALLSALDARFERLRHEPLHDASLSLYARRREPAPLLR
jgi:4-amino-4-deoxy-L-arabinose transferase-like glycosyltransferase